MKIGLVYCGLGIGLASFGLGLGLGLVYCGLGLDLGLAFFGLGLELCGLVNITGGTAKFGPYRVSSICYEKQCLTSIWRELDM